MSESIGSANEAVCERNGSARGYSENAEVAQTFIRREFEQVLVENVPFCAQFVAG